MYPGFNNVNKGSIFRWKWNIDRFEINDWRIDLKNDKSTLYYYIYLHE